jgi:hypothetical protein
MVLNFPRPFKDELLYGLIARHFWLSPLKSLSHMARQVFASGHATAVVDLPGRLESLQAAIGDSAPLTVQSLIRDHTLLPLHAPFMPPARLALIERDLMGNGGGAVHVRAGIMASKVQPAGRLLFCPSCAIEERGQTGEAYWHRVHQAPGVFVCPVHRVFLEESSVQRRFRGTRHRFVPAEDAIPVCLPRPIEETNPEHQILLHIAVDTAWLLENFSAGKELVDLQERYMTRAMELGYATGSRSIRWKLLLPEFRRRYSGELLQRLQCPLPTDSSDHWMARILRRPRAVQSPLRHLVLLQFMGMTAQTFFKRDIVVPLFGAGPWMCQNPVCPSRGKQTILEVRIEHSYEHRAPVGLFTCPICHRTECSVRTGDRESAWTRDFGPIWKSELESLWTNPDISLRLMAKRLGVDPLTVKRHAAKAGLPFPRKAKRITGRNGPPEPATFSRSTLPKLDTRRAEWVNLCRQFPSEGTTHLRRLAPACYIFLFRHDRDWLRLHSPPTSNTPASPTPVNWENRDSQISRMLPDAKAALLAEGGRPKWISLAALGRKLEALAWIQHHLRKLPRTRTLLASTVESRFDFAKRRIAWATSQMRVGGSKMAEWRLIQRAGLRPEVVADPGIREAVLLELR